jgi:hypothetical protein
MGDEYVASVWQRIRDHVAMVLQHSGSIGDIGVVFEDRFAAPGRVNGQVYTGAPSTSIAAPFWPGPLKLKRGDPFFGDFSSRFSTWTNLTNTLLPCSLPSLQKHAVMSITHLNGLCTYSNLRLIRIRFRLLCHDNRPR